MKGLVVILLMALVFASIPLAPAERAEGRMDVISNDLAFIMTDMDRDDRIEVIVRFTDHESRNEAIDNLDSPSLRYLERIEALPVALLEGTVDGILELSNLRSVVWIEHNTPMVPLLHETTTVIGANDVWNRVVVTDDGIEEDFNYLSGFSGIDGNGVTIVIVDTGVDAGHPDLDWGEKVVENWHKSSEAEVEPWQQMENSDTSYGHGTHCAGIAAGNGDASGGQKKGVAPGAKLIGVGGDWTPASWAVLVGLEWVYDHSKPGANPHNIRVASNSWGSAGGEYDPENAVPQMVEKLVYENSVAVIFAAGNSGGDGSDIQTNPQSNCPAAIGVAASLRNGEGLTEFSSRGQEGNYDTYPDVAAPGQDIWATTPRGTWLDIYQRQDEDMYYMAINGTSMATPHVAGLAALMMQAAPSLKVSKYHGEHDGGPLNDWNIDTTLIHEAELIMKMTADYMARKPNNGVPERVDAGINGHSYDFGQGYGLVNATRAIAVSLVLEELRTKDFNGDGEPDYPDATVDEALAVYEKTIVPYNVTGSSNLVETMWRGEWAHLIKQTGNPANPFDTFNTDQTHRILIPDGATHIQIDLHYTVYNSASGDLVTLDVWGDIDGDGSNDLSPQLFDFDGTKEWDMDIGNGGWAEFRVEGTGVTLPSEDIGDEFQETTAEYTVNVQLQINDGTEVETTPGADTMPFEFVYRGSGDNTIRTKAFDLRDLDPPDRSEKSDDFDWTIPLLIGVIALAVIFLKFKKVF